MNLAELTCDKAKALEGTAFRVELPDGTSVSMSLKEVLPYENADTAAGRRSAIPSPSVSWDLYARSCRNRSTRFEARQITLKLFIVPIGQNKDGTKYEAVFT